MPLLLTPSCEKMWIRIWHCITLNVNKPKRSSTNSKVDKMRATQQLVDALVFAKISVGEECCEPSIWQTPLLDVLVFAKVGVWANFGQPSNCWDYSVIKSQNRTKFWLVGGTKVGRSVGYIQTRASTGLFVNHCAADMAPTGTSRVAWRATQKNF